ncbi:MULTISPECIES: DUF2250 domain-containing protein [Acidiplasma]|uniref:DUF2250 domain-containing protein n=1 Tax=Acidiplasma cupricumulans TaxID=312540 RepID=A0A0Q0RY96_9ARCH|nr:DUF2250 domain-containing protein [Acidiplasma cupricumulans]KQB35079.1 hypothetical protein AOG55_07940 [Acidiplasma cupricumulans]
MEDDEIIKNLVFDNQLLMVLQHFNLAKLDYAKNIKIYTSIPQMNVNIYLERLENMGLIEKYSGSSIKRTEAKLKKTNEVHKHHTYYLLTNKGHYILKSIGPREYIKYLELPCLKMLAYKKRRNDDPSKRAKLINMGLLDKYGEITPIGESVLDLAKRRQINLPDT